MAQPKQTGAGKGEERSFRSLAPPARRFGFPDVEVEEGRKNRVLAVLSKMIMTSDLTMRVNTKGFSDEDVKDAVHHVASLWIKGGYHEKADSLVRVYGLAGEKGAAEGGMREKLPPHTKEG